MFATLTEDLVSGPSPHAEFELSLFVRPLVDTGRPGRYASQAMIVTTAARRMIELSKAGEKVRSIVVLGDEDAREDPMAHPEFRDISTNLRELTDKWFPKSKLTLLSTGLHVDDPERRHALSSYHRPIIYFEAGTQKTFAALTGEDPQKFKDVCDGLERIDIERWVLRTRFVRGEVDNSKDTEVRYWLSKVEQMTPGQVQVTTLDKPDAERKLKPITKTRLSAIGEKASTKLGREVEVLDVE